MSVKSSSQLNVWTDARACARLCYDLWCCNVGMCITCNIIVNRHNEVSWETAQSQPIYSAMSDERKKRDTSRSKYIEICRWTRRGEVEKNWHFYRSIGYLVKRFSKIVQSYTHTHFTTFYFCVNKYIHIFMYICSDLI